MVVKQATQFLDLPLALRTQLDTPNQNPFFTAAFLSALEDSACVTPENGWQPTHLWIEEGGMPLFYMPLYRKNHSWGEFVFDQNWANAYHRYGLRYYPKLVTSIPFTPSQGARWWSAPGSDEQALWQQAFGFITEDIDSGKDSSWHLLFSDRPPPGIQDASLMPRHDTQFHWHNRGYRDFESFLQSLKSRKRKSIRRERQKVHEQSVTVHRKLGTELSKTDWQEYYRCYCNTYHERGMNPHLTLAFFLQVGETMAENLLMVQARRENRFIAGSLCFFDSTALYGRHWGAIEDVDCLHFEACFYQGIEFCIERGLQHFDPGTQGEHKLIRGFEPTTTTSWHYIGHGGFREAIAEYLQSEQQHTQNYQQNAADYLPFKLSED